MDVRRVGESGLLLMCADTGEVRSTYARARREIAAVDIVPAATTVLLDGLADVAGVHREVASWRLDAADRPAAGPLVELPVRYDGLDLAAVAARWGLSEEDAARRHAAGEYVVAFCGFAPGFAYCTGLPEELAVPRLDSPRPRVEPGSVGLAGAFTGVYPTASPGGWQIIGHTDATLWRPDGDEPALLTPGTRVRFVEGPRDG